MSKRSGPFRYHSALDGSSRFDAEDLPYDCSNFEATLRSDLITRPLQYLVAHYPELDFGRAKVKEGVIKAKDHAFVGRSGRICTWADWKKAPTHP